MSGTRILLVEDQVGFRMIYGDLLAHAGYEVIHAGDGERGWELSKQEKPDLILLDLGLPKIDGFEVLRRVRSDAQTRSIPVIIFSVMGEQQAVKRAMQMGANDYTIKGFYTPMQILSKIKSQLNQCLPAEKLSYRIPLGPQGGETERLQREIGLTEGYRCHCGREMVLEMYPDHVRDGSHWFTARLVCPQCEQHY